MLPGFRPKPDAMRDLDGNASKRPRKRTARPEASTGDCPRYLRGDREAVRLWAELAPGRVRLGLLRDGDEVMFAAFCSEAAIYHRSVRALLRHGTTHDTNTNGRVKRPEVDIRKGALDSLIRLAAAFGMTPGDRARIEVPLGAAAGKRDDTTTTPEGDGGRTPVASIDDLLARRRRRRERTEGPER